MKKYILFLLLTSALVLGLLSPALALNQLILKKTTFAPGESIEISFFGVTDAEMQSQCWTAVARTGDPSGSYLDWTYLPAAGDGVLSLPAPAAPGSYEIRFYSGYSASEDNLMRNLSVPFQVSSGRTVGTITLDQAVYVPGQHLLVRYTDVSQGALDNGAWMAIARSGEPAGSYSDWKAVHSSSGLLWLTVPETAGHYELRYFPAGRASEENLSEGLRIPFEAAGNLPANDQVIYPVLNDFSWDLLTFTPGTGAWDGAYETSFKTLYLHQTGNTITGEYPEWDNGRIDGTLQNGILYGYWYESPGYAPPGDAGQFIAALYPDGQGFQGWWRYGNRGDWKDWSAGTRIHTPESARSENNLLVNGDASRGLYGWTDPDGIWITRTEYDGQIHAWKDAFFMPDSFAGSQGARTRIYQDVPVRDYAGAESTFSAMVRAWDTSNTDETILMVEFLDASGNLLDRGEATSAKNPEWHRISVSRTVPATAVTARLSLYAVYWYGSECDSYFDDVTFTLSASGSERTADTAGRSAYSRIEGEQWDRTHGAQAASQGGGCAGYIEDSDWIQYAQLDFGSGASAFAVNASSPSNGGTIEVHLDSPDGPLAGECAVSSTGSWDSWKDFRCPVTGVSGVHDLFLVFHGNTGQYLMNVNSFRFEPAGAGSASAAADLRQAEQRGIIPDCLLGTDTSEYIRATEFAALGVKLFEEFWQTQELREPTPFTDAPGHPLQAEIEKAWGLGFLKLLRGGELGDNGITRQMMAQMFCSLIQAFQDDSQAPLSYTMPQPFPDDADIFKSSRDSVYYLAANGIMGSVENGCFYPSAAATREQAISAANRIWTMEQGDDLLSDRETGTGSDFPSVEDLSEPVSVTEQRNVSAHRLTTADGALAAGAELSVEPLPAAGLRSAGEPFAAVEITGHGYDGAFFGSDVQLTLQVPETLEGDLGRYRFASFDRQTGLTQYFWPDAYDRQADTVTLNLPHLSPWWGTKMTQEEEIDAFLDEYSTRLAVAQSQSRQAASELEPYVRAKAQALGLTRQATEDLVQSAVNYLGGRFQGAYKDTIETGTKAITAVTRGVMDNDVDSMCSGLEDAVNGAIMHGWDELKFGSRIDKVLGSEFAGKTAGALLGSTNSVARMAGCLAEGDLSGAAAELGGVMQNVHPSVELATKGARFLASMGDTAFTCWKANQIEALYQVYKHGANGLFGNSVFPQDRQSFLIFLNSSSGFTMAKGVRRFYNLDKIGEVCERYGWDFRTYSELPEHYRNIFERRAEDGLITYFETRLAQEAEAEKIRARERECIVEMLNPYYGALYAGNYAHFFGENDGQFSLTARMERLIRVRQFISQYVNEDALNRAAGYHYGVLLNEWISLASQYSKADAIQKFCQYLQDLGFLKDGLEAPSRQTLEEQLALLKGRWLVPYTVQQGQRKGQSGVKAHDIYDSYLGSHSYGTGKAELDESGDLLITYTYHSGSVTRLRYHFIDENHVQETSLNTGRTETLTRADSN